MHKANVWTPSPEIISNSNINAFMRKHHFKKIQNLHQWSTEHYEDFWSSMLDQLQIKFINPPAHIMDSDSSPEAPNWLPNSRMNIAESCFLAPSEHIAIIQDAPDNTLKKFTYAELNQMSNQVANSLENTGVKAGAAIAVIMPMNFYAVAIYLGIIKMGGVVVSIADSFSSREIATRLDISNCELVITQDVITRGNKCYPLHRRITETNPPPCIVISEEINKNPINFELRKADIPWEKFLVTNQTYSAHECNAMDPINILFSSGTTGTPKAIPWTHVTAIKAASDGYFHQDIHTSDRICWPTNLGWMMGPWLIFAGLINQSSIVLYPNAPKGRNFCQFVCDAEVSILGLVPTMVANWRESQCVQHIDWSKIRLFSSSGECSNPDDMSFLMQLADNKPVIEYCGGTEIGGAYISSTIIQKNIASQFSTPVMGIRFTLLDDHAKPSNQGEVAIVAPSFGLSTKLLNGDHHKVYFADMPKTDNGLLLRRHGDRLMRLENGYYTVLGRVDDTMNLGGIKVSAVEIERAIVGLPHLLESAAVACPSKDGRSTELVIFVVLSNQEDIENLKSDIQKLISNDLNPLFRVCDVVVLNELPKTASNKILRRTLKDQYRPSASNNEKHKS